MKRQLSDRDAIAMLTERNFIPTCARVALLEMMFSLKAGFYRQQLLRELNRAGFYRDRDQLRSDLARFEARGLIKPIVNDPRKLPKVRGRKPKGYKLVIRIKS